MLDTNPRERTARRGERIADAARVVLGHSSAVMTEIYAEMDFTKAAQIMGEAG